MRKVLCMLTIITAMLGGCEPTTECPLPENDGGVPTETWRCTADVTVYEGDDETTQPMDVVFEGQGVQLELDGCVVRYAEALPMGAFEDATPAWTVSATAACAGFSTTNMWNERVFSLDGETLFSDQAYVSTNDRTYRPGLVTCAPLE